MHERNADWAELAVQLIGATGRDRDVAVWQACAEVVRNIDRYRPGRFVKPCDEWSLDDAAQVDALRRCRDMQALRTAANGCPGAFGRLRAGVTEFEASEASKVQTLVWTLQTLYRLRDKATDTAAVDRLATAVGDLLTMEWRCVTVPLEGDYRAWASASTRRYDLLPKHWRHV